MCKIITYAIGVFVKTLAIEEEEKSGESRQSLTGSWAPSSCSVNVKFNTYCLAQSGVIPEHNFGATL